jgi:hypothetical protein
MRVRKGKRQTPAAALGVEWTDIHRGVNHAHAVWRDPETDFGGDALAAHHAAHHMS